MKETIPFTILQVVEPGTDGVFRHVEGLIAYLLDHGARVHLAYSDRRGSDRLKQLVARVTASGGSALNLRVGNSPEPGDIRAGWQLRQFVVRTRPGVIHAHSSKAGGLTRVFLRGKKAPPIFYTPNAYFGMGERGGIREMIFNKIESRLGNVGITINVSQDEADFAATRLKINPAHRVIIPNAVDTHQFHPGNEMMKSHARGEFGLPADALVLGTLGRLSYQKDPGTLYRAFAEISAKNPRIYLAHVGDGELDLSELIHSLGIEDRVVRIRHTSNPENFYQALDGFILSSRYEGLSFSILEAMAASLPLILTDVPGNREFLRLGLSHLWSSSAGDVGGLASAIGKWAEDLPLRRPGNHRKIAEEKFSFEACYGAILAAYRQ